MSPALRDPDPKYLKAPQIRFKSREPIPPVVDERAEALRIRNERDGQREEAAREELRELLTDGLNLMTCDPKWSVGQEVIRPHVHVPGGKVLGTDLQGSEL